MWVNEPTSPAHSHFHALCIPRDQTARELLLRLEAINDTPIRFTAKGSQRYGRTVESRLGVPANSLPYPDYKGIELKSTSSNRKYFFCMNPKDVTGSQSWAAGLKKETGSSRHLISTNGHRYVRPRFDEKANQLQVFSRRTGRFLHYWDFDEICGRLLEKHRETFWLNVEARGADAFSILTVTHTRRPVIGIVEDPFRSGSPYFEYRLGSKDHGVQLRGKQDAYHRLFPMSTTYSATK